MDTNNLIDLLNKSREQLQQILNECQTGTNELVLLNSIMSPLLEDFSAIESELFSSNTFEKSTEAITEKASLPRHSSD